MQALEAQVASIQRLANVAEDASNKLRLLDARLDEIIARAVELSVTGATEVGGLDAEVESVVHELEALRQAMEDTRGASTGNIDASVLEPRTQAERQAAQRGQTMPGT